MIKNFRSAVVCFSLLEAGYHRLMRKHWEFSQQGLMRKLGSKQLLPLHLKVATFCEGQGLFGS
jgi:hypothetical protein